MESTVTETITTESTPTGSVQTHETTVERDEGDITESWLNARFDAIREGILEQLSEHRTMLQQLTEIQSSLMNRIPDNLTTLLSQQQSTITSLTNQLAELATRLLTPPAVAVVEPNLAAEESAVAMQEPAEAVAQESPRQRRRAV